MQNMNPRFRAWLASKGVVGTNQERLDKAATAVWEALCKFDSSQLRVLERNQFLTPLLEVAEMWGVLDGATDPSWSNHSFHATPAGPNMTEMSDAVSVEVEEFLAGFKWEDLVEVGPSQYQESS